MLAIDADCVVYTPRLTDLGEVRHPGERQERRHDGVPVPSEPPARRRSRSSAGGLPHGGSAARQRAESGQPVRALPLALTGMSRAIDKLTLQERADWSVYDSTAIKFDNMRFGAPVDEISVTANEFLAFNSSIFTEQVWLLADALHAGIDDE